MNKTCWSKRILGVTLTSALTACGGGSSDSSSPVITPTINSITLNGTATNGRAIADRMVEAKCANGSASVLTKTDGKFTLIVTEGRWPCVARVTLADSKTLHTVANGSGTVLNANITPVTELVVASLAGSTPASYYSGFNAAAATALSSAAITSATTAVTQTLKTAGVDLATAGDPVSATVNTAYTDALTALETSLAAGGTTLADMSRSVADNSTTLAAGTVPAPSGTPSVPTEWLLRASASTCPALRSGSYRVMIAARGVPAADQYGKIVVNAATLGVTFTDNSTGRWVAHATEACRFTDPDDGGEIIVSQAGLLMFRSPDGAGSFETIVAVPEQTHAVAALAGDWNRMGMSSNLAGNAYVGATGFGTINSNGSFTSNTHCQNDSTWGLTGTDCAALAANKLETLSANPAGGFDIRVGAQSTASGRAVMYQSGGGTAMIFAVYADGSMALMTKQRSNSLPAVGRLSKGWNLQVDAQMRASTALSVSSNTALSVDSSAGSYVRTQHSISGTAFDFTETVFINNPRPGINYRPSATATTNSGTSVNVRDFQALQMLGMGINPVLIPSAKIFNLSVDRP